MAKRLWYVTARDFDVIKDDVEDLQTNGGGADTQDLSTSFIFNRWWISHFT
jgi:hypothetical protein